jgi:hypothetical protein
MEPNQKRDKRKVLLVLPLLVLPFLAMAFYAGGGGKGQHQFAQQSGQRGINASLPDAAISKNQPQTKYGVYQQSDRDSAGKHSNGIKDVADRLGFNSQPEDPQTRQINQKLEALNKEISKPAEPIVNRPALVNSQPSTMKSDVDRLEALMKNMKEDKAEDPEMAQLNGMLQKIIDIQHPGQVQQRITETQAAVRPDSQFHAIPAVIVDDQKAVQGATIRLRLQDSIRIGGVFIPKGHDLFGTCNITNQRLLLNIKNIRLGTSIVPVDLTVYSLDGMAGIYAPEAELSDAVGNGTTGALGNIGISGFDLTTQVAGAGLDAAKSLLSKKVKRVKVRLKAGYSVLLRDNQLKTR